MPKLEGFETVASKLNKLSMKYGEANVSVIVGYTQSYALPVHERLDVFHPVGQAKYLEQPARALKKVFADIILKAVKKGAKLVHAILLAGLRLQRESQLLVPVDTGALKNSAFTRKE